MPDKLNPPRYNPPAPISRPDESWTLPRPQPSPAPSYAPAVIALAVLCILLGLLTTYLISLLGLLLLAIGVSQWIGGLRREHS